MEAAVYHLRDTSGGLRASSIYENRYYFVARAKIDSYLSVISSSRRFMLSIQCLDQVSKLIATYLVGRIRLIHVYGS